METIEPFKALVTLYRLLDRPVFENNSFQNTVAYTSYLADLLRCLWDCEKYNIELTVYSTNHSTEMDDEFPNVSDDEQIQIKITVPQTENGFFYQNVEKWIERTISLKKGRLTKNTYLVDEDIFVDDEPGNAQVSKVKKTCQLINQLSELAHYHDEKQSFNDAYRLVFVIPDKDDKVYRPVVLETQLTTEVLRIEPLDTSLLDSILIEQKAGNTIHAIERLNIYRIALAEIIEKMPADENAFLYLIKHWAEVAENFHKFWEHYVSGFSFNKLKAEMAEQQASFSQKLSDIVVSLSGRLFSLPISVAGIILLERAGSPIANWFYLLSSVLISYMVFSSVRIQRDNLSNAKASYEMSFSKFDTTTSDIKQELDNVLERLGNTFNNIDCTLKFYACLAWVPLLVAFFYIILKSECKFLQIVLNHFVN